ncbi:MAG: insulinase family protein [Phycisphaeraceae bacterium]|nr:insulinase family protein [Phycisphaeraceae bacterium]MBX3405522.1 insulinase family protein [Phycisphaeraceae bacterium]
MGVTFIEHTLANGLRIIAEVDPHAHSAAAGYFVRTGARDEASAVMGVSHFLEHMMFKGTARRTAERINADFDRIGARNNAYTSHEMTCFHATVLPDRLLGEGGALDILGDMMRPALREEDFTTEKNVILEEIAMYQDNPFWVLYERAVEVHYGADPARDEALATIDAGMHPLGHRVLGTKASIAALSVEQMRAYFEHRYSADNTVVALAGKVDFDAAVREIERLSGSWARTGAQRAHAAPPYADRDFTLRSEKVNRGYALMLTPAPDANDPRRYAATLLAQALGGPDNSRLHWALVETGLAESAEAGFDPRDRAGELLVFVSCDPDRLDECWSIVEREAAALRDTVTHDDLARIRAKAATGVTVAGERPGGRMQRLGRQWMYRPEYTTLEEELERINAVTLDDVRALLGDVPLRPRTVGRMLPAQ